MEVRTIEYAESLKINDLILYQNITKNICFGIIVEFKTVENYLLINFRRGKITDGEQNIDNFVNSILKS